MAMRWVTTNVRFDPTDYADLQRLAAASGNSLAECIRLAVGHYLGHPERGPEATEAAAPYGDGEPVESEVPAVVRGQSLLLRQPLPGHHDGEQVYVRVVGAAEVAQRRRHRAMIAALRAEFEALPPGRPAPTGPDDRELYR